MHKRADKPPQRLRIHGFNGHVYASSTLPSPSLPRLRSEPGGLDTSLVELALSVFPLDSESHCTQFRSIPTADKLTLATVLSIDGISKLDVVCMATDRLGI